MIPDDDVPGDLSMEGSYLRASLIASEVKQGKTKGGYEPPTALRVSMRQHPQQRSGTPSGLRKTASQANKPSQSQQIQDSKVPEPKSALVPQQSRPMFPSGYTGYVNERDSKTMIGYSNQESS